MVWIGRIAIRKVQKVTWIFRIVKRMVGIVTRIVSWDLLLLKITVLLSFCFTQKINADKKGAEKPKTHSQKHHLDIAHLDQRNQKIHNALHKKSVSK